MRQIILAALCAALVVAPLQAEPVVLKPSSSWTVDFAENKCRLLRFFGPETDRHLIVIEQYAPSPYFGLTVAGASFETLGKLKQATVAFYDDQAPVDVVPLVGEMAPFGKMLVFEQIALAKESRPDPRVKTYVSRLPLLDPAEAGDVDFVSVAGKDAEIRLMTGSLGEPVKVLNQCLLGLIESWGLDVEKHRTASRMPRAINENAVLTKMLSQIPSDRIGNGLTIFRLRVIVDAAGKVESCRLIDMPDPNVTTEICKTMKRAKFEPALNAESQPMRSFQSYGVTIN